VDSSLKCVRIEANSPSILDSLIFSSDFETTLEPVKVCETERISRESYSIRGDSPMF